MEAGGTASSVGGDATSVSDAAPEPLVLDLSPFDGLHRPIVLRLTSLFYSDSAPLGGFRQLNDLEGCISTGGSATALDNKLQQLSESALQAGASLLSATCRAFRADPRAHCTPENV